MNKLKRTLAIVLAAILMVSLISVVTFAEAPVFARDFVDENGVLLNTAYIVSDAVIGKEKGSNVIIEWDNTDYQFTVGKNAFATLEDACTAADMDMTLEKFQVMLLACEMGDLNLNRSMEVFGINWNTNPNKINPTDPTKPWDLNPVWNERSTIVANVVVGANASDYISVYGVEIQGRIFDNLRPISSAKTVFTVGNSMFRQTPEVLSSFETNKYMGATNLSVQRYYAINLRNYNSINKNKTAKNNKDETYFKNFRVESLATPCDRIIDEIPSPKITLDGFFVDTTKISGITFQGYADSPVGCYMKWTPYTDKINVTVKNSCFIGNKFAFHIEGLQNPSTGSGTATPVGTAFPEQYTEINVCNNLFYNSFAPLSISVASFSKVNIDGNYAVSTSGTSSYFVGFSGLNNTTDYTKKINVTNNTMLGVKEFNFESGLPTSKIDATGNYINQTYTDDWINGTSTVVPTGKVRYEYAWGDAKRTVKMGGAEGFTIANATIDHEKHTVDVKVAANSSATYTPIITGVSSFSLYESDKDFSNIDTYMYEKPVDECKSVNYYSYYLLVIHSSSDDGKSTVYKLTINKLTTSTVALDSITATPSDALVRQDGREFFVNVSRDTEDAAISLVSKTATKYTVTDESTSKTITANKTTGAYEVKGLEPGEKRTLRVRVYRNSYSIYYFVHVIRNLNTGCEITSIDPAVSLVGDKLSVSIEKGGKYEFAITASDKASVIAWRGTKVYALNTTTGRITIEDIAKGVNVYNLAVVAEDGKSIKEYELTITAANEADPEPPAPIDDKDKIKFSVQGATQTENQFDLQLAKDVTSAKLNIIASNCTYKLYSNADCTVTSSNTIALEQKETFVYAIAKNQKSEEKYCIRIISERTSSKYTDSKSIPAWAKPYVDALNNSGTGIIKGDDKGNFNATKNMTRYEIAAVAVRMAGIDASQFANVKLNYADSIASWASNYVKAVTKLKIMSGTTVNGKTVFNGTGKTTRAQLAKILVEVSFKSTGVTESIEEFYNGAKQEIDAEYNSYRFADENSIQAWAKPYMKVAVWLGMISGTTTNGRNYALPNNFVTRAQATTMIARYYGLA